jgi:histidinol-phosphate/aromatic aminotransferase/cobyric acid decarboxylase-like protein
LRLLKLDPAETSVTFACGSSQAFTQALAALTKPGETIAMEQPNYEPFVKTAQFLNLKIKFFKRGEHHAKNAVAGDLAAIKKVASKSRTLVLTNPHFPLGGVYDEATLRRIAKLFKFVIIDEVFLPQFRGGRATQFTGGLPPNVLVTGSFSKSIGLGAIRLGWIASQKKFFGALERMAYHFHIDMPLPILLVGERGLDRWQLALDRLEKLAAPNRALLQTGAARHPGRFSHNLETGHVAMLEVGNGKKFVDAMIREGVLLKDGALVGLPRHVRIHWHFDHAAFKRIWEQIDALLPLK